MPTIQETLDKFERHNSAARDAILAQRPLDEALVESYHLMTPEQSAKFLTIRSARGRLIGE